MIFSMVIVVCLVGNLIGSGLSLGLFRVLPLGGPTPKLGRVMIFSIFGLVYGPKTEGHVLMYSGSPRFFVQS